MENTDETFLEIVAAHARYTGTWKSAFRVFAPCIPLIAAFISLLFSLFSQAMYGHTISSGIWLFLPSIVGTTLACLLWVILASIILRFTAVDAASAKSYDILCQHLTLLDNSINIVCNDAQAAQHHTYNLLQRLGRTSPQKNVLSPTPTAHQHLPSTLSTPLPLTTSNGLLNAGTLLVAYRDAIYAGLMQKTGAWTTGTGYMKLWSLMDKAEEIMISIEAPEKVVQVAIYDDMCLRQSNIDNSGEWVNKLRTAVAIISANATPYLPLFSRLPVSHVTQTEPSASESPDSSQENVQPAIIASPTSPLENQSNSNSGDSEETDQLLNNTEFLKQAQARAILQLAHRILANFKARNWNSIITARNQLLHTMTFASLTAYIALEITIIMQINPHHIMIILIFGLIGALAGLFGRLYHESQSDNEINDYHLGTTRLMVIPLLSGLASIIGVLIIAKATNLDDFSTTKSILANFPLAATFGLTPNLVLNQLQQKSEKYMGNLRSTQPTMGQ